MFDEPVQKILELDFDGMNATDIAQQVEWKYHSVLAVLYRYRLEYFLYRHSFQIVKRIRMSAGHGTSAEKIADEFNTHRSVIQSIINADKRFENAIKLLEFNVQKVHRTPVEAKSIKWRCPACERISWQVSSTTFICTFCEPNANTQREEISSGAP